MILTAVMAHQRELIRKAVVALLIGANTAAGARVKATRVEPNKKAQLPAISVYTLSDDLDEGLSGQSAPRELSRDLNLEITGWVAHADSNPADDQMDDLAAQIEAVIDSHRYLEMALTIAAVDHTTGKLTIPSHGLATGDRLVGLSASGGGVVPAGLSLTAEYWAIAVDANTIQLARSSSLALAGTAISFTGNGTLPLQALVGTAAESLYQGTTMEMAEVDGRSDPLVGIVTISYAVRFRTAPAAPVLVDFTAVDAKYQLAGGVADTVPGEDTFTVPT